MVVESQPGKASSFTPSPSPSPTKTDPFSARPWIPDEVFQLRVSGSDQTFPLRTGDVIGAAPGASIELADPKALVSRVHARVTHDASSWQIADVGSKNGIRADGNRRAAVKLVPGIEIGIGSLVLVAESHSLVKLRRYLRRVLGWEADQWPVMDRALRALRAAAEQHQAMVIASADDAVAVARQISVDPALVVPALSGRSEHDLHRIVVEYAIDAIEELHAELSSFQDEHREWVVRHQATSYAEIEIATLRLVARNTFPGANDAASRLGLTSVAFRQWFRRRGLELRPQVAQREHAGSSARAAATATAPRRSAAATASTAATGELEVLAGRARGEAELDQEHAGMLGGGDSDRTAAIGELEVPAGEARGEAELDQEHTQ